MFSCYLKPKSTHAINDSLMFGQLQDLRNQTSHNVPLELSIEDASTSK